MSEWISIKDRLPKDCEDVYVKTDCDDCPIVSGIFFENKFIIPVLSQCDHHYESDQKFHFIKAAGVNEIESYLDRITHWMLLPEPSENK